MNKIKEHKSVLQAIAAFCLIFSLSLSAFAVNGVQNLKDGAYLIKANTSYVNPDTGKTATGGDDSPMGKIMCDRYVGKDMLLEKSGGKLYVTFSMTGAKQLKDFKVQIVDANGNFRDASYEITAQNAEKDEAHYRIELKENDRYISPSFVVEMMKKNIQFFITPNLEGAVSGTGKFKSEKVEAEPKTEAPKTTVAEVPSSAKPEPTTEAVSVTESAETQETDTQNKSKTGVIVGGVVVGVAVLATIIGTVIYNHRQNAAIAEAIAREKAEKEKNSENQK